MQIPVYLCICHIIISCAFASNQGIIVDDTLGKKQVQQLTGPNYHIPADLGQTSGENLFHSFYQFNLHEGEKAIFHASDGIHRIISRVTGPNSSWIDGGIQSMANADLYFFNPNGIIFGPNAWLDVQQSFHVGTYDYIRFSDQFIFDRDYHSPELTSASPEAFGFIDHDIGSIRISGKGYVTSTIENPHKPSLNVPPGQTLSLISGDMTLDNGTLDSDLLFPVGTLISEKGRINMASLASKGEVVVLDEDLDVSSFDQWGNITILNASAVSASSGKVFIRSNQLILDQAYINAGQYSPDATHVIGFAGGNIDIQVNQLEILNGGGIFLETYGVDSSGDINIHARDIKIDGFDSSTKHVSSISTSSILLGNSFLERSTTEISGDAGNVYINAENLELSNGGMIEANAMSYGNGGEIVIHISETINLIGSLSDINLCGIMAISLLDRPGGGNAGNIHIQAKNLNILNGAKIFNSTATTGNCGTINIHIEDKLSMHGGNTFQDPETSELIKQISGVLSTTSSDIANAGHSGQIQITGKTLHMDYFSQVNTSSRSSGKAGIISLDFETIEINDHSGIYSKSLLDANAGRIMIRSEQFITMTNQSMISTESHGKGGPGGVVVDTPELLMDNQSIITSTARSSNNTVDGQGVIIGRNIDPGIVHNESDTITIDHQSEINTSSYGQGMAGTIVLISKQIHIDHQSIISSDSLLQGKSGDSGLVFIDGDTIHIDNGSEVSTKNAGEGNAGQIHIDTDTFSLDHHSRIYSVNTYNPDGGTAGLIFIAHGLDSVFHSDIPVVSPCQQISIKNQSGLSTSSMSKNGAGGIVIRTKRLDMDQHAFISSENNFLGDSESFGIISIESDLLYMTDHSKISTQSKGDGDAGGISLEVSALKLLNHSFICSSGTNPSRGGAGGHILIARSIDHIDDFIFGQLEIDNIISAYELLQALKPSESIHLNDSSYITTSTAGSGDAGGILIDAKNIHLTNHGHIFSESSSATGGGTAGHIKIGSFDNLSLRQGSGISTQAINTSAPDILLPDYVELDQLNGMIFLWGRGRLLMENSWVTSSVLGGLGNGGNLQIHAYDILLNESKVIANAYEGNGGDINIVSDHLIQSSDSVISASSELGIDGKVSINAISENFDRALLQLPDTFLSVTKWLKTPCKYRDTTEVSRFIIHNKDAHPTSFDDWLPAR